MAAGVRHQTGSAHHLEGRQRRPCTPALTLAKAALALSAEEHAKHHLHDFQICLASLIIDHDPSNKIKGITAT
jgi:hypothetical protein